MQPASGARDLNPQQVELNHLIGSKLSSVFKLWGYEEVSPPYIERLETLMAGNAISNRDILKVVADEALGLRPEMTTSIARAASTRLRKKPRPLRLWTNGAIFKNKEIIESGTYIEENEECGIELFGVKSITAEIELLSLLLDSLMSLNLDESLKPTLLIGHTELMDLILSNYDIRYRDKIKEILTNLNEIEINELGIEKESKEKLLRVIKCRGIPKLVLSEMSKIYGNIEIIDKVNTLFATIEPISRKYNIRIQLDPTYSPNFQLYDGFIFQLICQGPNNQITIAKGGRYDKIVSIFDSNNESASGVGFSFSIDKIRELIDEKQLINKYKDKFLIAYSNNKNIDDALNKQREFHKNGSIAIIELASCNSADEAMELLVQRKCNKLEWIE